MNEILTRSEIERQFDNEWILLSDPEVDEHLEVLRGKVVAHSKDQDSVYQKAVELRLRHSAFLYTGQVPDDLIIIL
jgi:hypothetical protein